MSNDPDFSSEKLFFKNSSASTWKLPTNPNEIRLICKFVAQHTGTGIYCKYIEYTWIKKDPCTHNIITITSSAQGKSQHKYAFYRQWTGSLIRAKLIFNRIFFFRWCFCLSSYMYVCSSILELRNNVASEGPAPLPSFCRSKHFS